MSVSIRSLSASALTDGLKSAVAHECASTARVLAYLAEFDRRKLYRDAGYPSMFDYCKRELHLSEGATHRRITAARKIRKFPMLFDAVQDGRLHLTGILLLAPHLTPDSVGELVSAATHKTRADIELMLAHRFPKADVPTRIRPIPSAVADPPPTVVANVPQIEQCVVDVMDTTCKLAPARVCLTTPSAPAPAPVIPTKIAPLAPERFELRATIAQKTHDLLRRAQELFSSQVPSGDVDEILCMALTDLVAKGEKLKFAATSRPRANESRTEPGKRYIPKGVRRAVHARDGARCTFVGQDGRRCEGRKFLEFDHVLPIARGGESSVENLRLRCRAHNQLEAERLFGADFMEARREACG